MREAESVVRKKVWNWFAEPERAAAAAFCAFVAVPERALAITALSLELQLELITARFLTLETLVPSIGMLSLLEEKVAVPDRTLLLASAMGITPTAAIS